MFLYTVLSGNTGVMRSDQAQLGIIYAGLFGSAALLFLRASESGRAGGGIFLAGLFMATLPLVMIAYRKGRFLDIDSFPIAGRELGDRGIASFRRFEVILNAVVIVAALALAAMAMKFAYQAGFSSLLSGSVAFLQKGSSFSGWGYVALIILPLFYQVVDITNWQRIATQVKDQVADGKVDAEDARFRGVFLVYSTESALMWMFMCTFGALAISATGTEASDTAFSDFVTRVVNSSSPVESWIAALLLAAIFAIGLSTMSAIFSATMLAVREDLLPTFYVNKASNASIEKKLVRRTVAVGFGLYLAIAAGFYLADRVLKISFGSEQFLAILFAFYCGQLAFVPLIAGPLWRRSDESYGTISPAWALAVLGTGAIAGTASQAAYLITGRDVWLWGAIPLCLMLSWLAYFAGRVGSRRS